MLDGLDSEGKDRIVALLQGMKKENDCLYIISHDIELKDVFENRVSIKKENGISYFIEE